MRHVLCLVTLALAAPASAQSGGAFTVTETGRSYGSLQEAVNAIGSGEGTIRIAPGRYRDCAVQEAGRVAFVAEKAGTAIFDDAICESKATLVTRGEGTHVQGIVFTHMIVPDGNGAGIRMEKGDLTVVDSMFLDGQCGILSANDQADTITIERSTFAGLGKDPTGNGAHALYIGGSGRLKVTRSRFERGTGGHYLKTRNPQVEITDNSFDDSKGSHTNYMIDLSWGARGRIAGNSFVQGGGKDNYSTMIAVAAEGAEHGSAGLVIENNRAWLAPAFKHDTTFVGNWSRDTPTLRGNTLAARIAPIARR